MSEEAPGTITEANYVGAALLRMKSVPPNADGTIGHTITEKSPEWRAWRAYFYGKGMDIRASYMHTRRETGYMVPCKSPADFDPDIEAVRKHYAWRVHRGEVDSETRTGRLASEMTPQERQDVLNRLALIHPMFAGYADEETQRQISEARKAMKEAAE